MSNVDAAASVEHSATVEHCAWQGWFELHDQDQMLAA